MYFRFLPGNTLILSAGFYTWSPSQDILTSLLSAVSSWREKVNCMCCLPAIYLLSTEFKEMKISHSEHSLSLSEIVLVAFY